MKCVYCGKVTENNIDEYVCSECLERDFTSCDDCGVWVHNDEIRTVRNRAGEMHVCEKCYVKNTENNSK